MRASCAPSAFPGVALDWSLAAFQTENLRATQRKWRIATRKTRKGRRHNHVPVRLMHWYVLSISIFFVSFVFFVVPIMSRTRLLGIDYGKVRIGLAVTDPDCRIAS